MGKLLFFNMVIISISLSIDALGIGIAYQLKNVKITSIAKLIIGGMSTIVMFISLRIGELAALYMPSDIVKILGVSLLLLIGIVFIRNGLYGSKEATYDFNKSANIEPIEAIVLGIALSMDTISAGIAVSALGICHGAIPFMVGFMQMIFLTIGEKIVGKIQILQRGNNKICGVFSGIILIIMAIFRGIFS